jgi:diguanylate cyclase (GGDEF)-like protein
MTPVSTREQIGNDFLAWLGKKKTEETQANHFLGVLVDTYSLLSATILTLGKNGSLHVFAHRGLSGSFIKDLYAKKTLPVIDAAFSGETILPGGDPRLSDPAWRLEHECKALYAAPCRIHGGTAGAFIAEFRDPALDDVATRAAFANYAQMSAILLALKDYHVGIGGVPEADPLTGLGTFKTFHEELSAELSRGKRSGKPVSLMIIKVRHLRELNDTYGHVVADQALVELSQIVRNQFRAVDSISRSGSSFYIVMPDTPKEKASAVAGRIVAAMTATPPGKKDVVLKIAIGAGTFPSDGDTERILIPHVEDMVHESVRKGGNAVTVFGD